jgi:hypothetical protein
VTHLCSLLDLNALLHSAQTTYVLLV